MLQLNHCILNDELFFRTFLEETTYQFKNGLSKMKHSSDNTQNVNFMFVRIEQKFYAYTYLYKNLVKYFIPNSATIFNEY